MERDLGVLCVCTHNRTRSVLMGGHLEHRRACVGIPVTIATAGFEPGGLPPTPEAVRRLDAQGVDVRGHLSHRITDADIDAAGLVLTAERRHVVEIASRRPDAFAKTFTLPELVERGTAIGGRDERTVADWIGALDEGRPRSIDYLDAEIGEIDDPTGLGGRDWDRTERHVRTLVDRMCRLLWCGLG